MSHYWTLNKTYHIQNYNIYICVFEVFLSYRFFFVWWFIYSTIAWLYMSNNCYDKARQCIKNQRHYFANEVPYTQSYGFSSSHVQMWELDQKEGWTPKNWCFQTVVLEKTFESSLDSKEIIPVNPKGNQLWIFIGRTDAEFETPKCWSPDAKSQSIGKDLDAGKNWRQKEKGVAEDEMVVRHYLLKGHTFEQTPGNSSGQRSMACCSLWDCRVRHD